MTNLAVKEIYEDDICDISNYTILGHAMAQYMNKCCPGLSLLQINQTMKNKLRTVKRVFLNKTERKNRISYMDEDENIYIVDQNKVVTVFPNERIFVAKPMYASKKMGNKWM